MGVKGLKLIALAHKKRCYNFFELFRNSVVLNQKNQKVSVNSTFSPERKSVFKSESGQTHFHINVFAVVCNNHLLKGEFNSS